MREMEQRNIKKNFYNFYLPDLLSYWKGGGGGVGEGVEGCERGGGTQYKCS
jgi:hypothetical protein